jgi:hypothetical protein
MRCGVCECRRRVEGALIPDCDVADALAVWGCDAAMIIEDPGYWIARPLRAGR